MQDVASRHEGADRPQTLLRFWDPDQGGQQLLPTFSQCIPKADIMTISFTETSTVLHRQYDSPHNFRKCGGYRRFILTIPRWND